MTPLSSIPRAASSVGGALLAAGTQGVASLRRARKPLHPDGEVLTGRIYRTGSAVKAGVDWLDDAGEDDADVRLSRAIGLPRALPDIHGLALRVHLGDGDADRSAAQVGDILFATTGWGRVTRFTLTMSRHPRTRPLTTLLPYDTDSGALLLGADGLGAETYELSWARPAGDWHPFGVLRLSTRHSADREISFDPVLHQLPGLRQYPTVRRLREPAYLRARRSRADHISSTTTAHADPTNQEIHHVN